MRHRDRKAIVRPDCPLRRARWCHNVPGLSAWIVRDLVRFSARLYADRRYKWLVVISGSSLHTSRCYKCLRATRARSPGSSVRVTGVRVITFHACVSTKRYVFHGAQRRSFFCDRVGPCRYERPGLVRPWKLTVLRGEVGTVADAAVTRPCAYVHRFELLPHRTNAPPADDRIDVPPAAGPPAYTYRTAPPAAGNGTGFATVRVGVRQVSTPVQQCAADGSTGEPGGTPRTP